MQCDLRDAFHERCTQTAAHHIWCPTWIQETPGRNAAPMYFCLEHARTFHPDFNPYAKDKELIYWDEQVVPAYSLWCAQGGESPTFQDWADGRSMEVAVPPGMTLPPPNPPPALPAPPAPPARLYPGVIAVASDGREVIGDLQVTLGNDGIVLDLVNPNTGDVLLTNCMDIANMAGLLK